MANPNIVNVSSILGKIATQEVVSSLTSIVTAGSNTIVKVNNLTAANIQDSALNGNIDAYINKGTGTDVYIAKEIVVPGNSSLVLISKDNSIYLEETDALQLKANDSSYINAICSYEIIS